MSRSSQIITGIIVLLIIAAGCYFWYQTSIPTTEEVDAVAVKVEKVDPNVLSSQSANEVMTMQTNGNLPLMVGPGDVGRDNPFSD